MSGISYSTIKVNRIYNFEKVLKMLDWVFRHKSMECTSVLHQPDGVGSQGGHLGSFGKLNGFLVALLARVSLGRSRPDAIARFLTPSPDISGRRRFIHATPSPHSEIEEVKVEDVEMDENHDVDHSNTKEALQWSFVEVPFFVSMEPKGRSTFVQQITQSSISNEVRREFKIPHRTDQLDYERGDEGMRQLVRLLGRYGVSADQRSIMKVRLKKECCASRIKCFLYQDD
ncbi:hypothetical protein Tco_1530894 [Tanacetum coccineum]